MNAINVYFTDEEIKHMKKKKQKSTWHDYILNLYKGGKINKINGRNKKRK